MEDHERPLNPRGIAGATAMAGWLKTMGAIPDHALVSDAARTTETWDLVAKELSLDIKPIMSRDLYLAPPLTMLEAIKATPNSAETIIVIGHQPGMSILVERMSDGSEPTNRNRAFQHFPTAATALIDLPIDYWAEADFGIGVFSRFSSPKELATA